MCAIRRCSMLHMNSTKREEQGMFSSNGLALAMERERRRELAERAERYRRGRIARASLEPLSITARRGQISIRFRRRPTITGKAPA
jgi:hypothetical protein